jgi:two-component system, LuxR family, response regulator FixJ
MRSSARFSTPRTVFIVDDDEPFRESLAFLLRSVSLRTTCCASAPEFLEKYRPGEPGCLILDVRLPDVSGLRFQHTLHGRNVQLPVVLISGHADVGTVVTAMRNGAVDFLQKPVDEQRVLDAVQQALARDVQERETRESVRILQEKLGRLTSRERQVMDLVVEGRLNKQVAAELGISSKTVEEHRARVMMKMEASDLPSLVRMVVAANRSHLTL